MLNYRNENRLMNKRQKVETYSVSSSSLLFSHSITRMNIQRERERGGTRREERRERAFCNISFPLLSTFSVLSFFSFSCHHCLHIFINLYLRFFSFVLCSGQLRGFFVQVYDRPAYVKHTRISLHENDQLEIHSNMSIHTNRSWSREFLWQVRRREGGREREREKKTLSVQWINVWCWGWWWSWRW